MDIKIGIKTSGHPEIQRQDGYYLLKNMLIGDGFHWEKVVPVTLPGEIEIWNGISSQDEEVNYNEISNDNISLVNIVPLETYLESVVGSEMNPDAPQEFLKAQAIVARNWALGKILNLHPFGRNESKINEDEVIGWDDTATHKGFDVCSDDHCQRYQGIQPISLEALKALRETAGEVLLDINGDLIDTRFSKCCGGRTELFSTCWQPEDFPSLESFPDPWCDMTSLSEERKRDILKTVMKDYDIGTPLYGYRWETEVTKKDIEENLIKKFGRNIGAILTIEAMHRGPSGRIDLLRLKGEKRNLVLGKELWIRRLLSKSHLYSSAFEIDDVGERLQLRGKGWGHGVGMCQIGAARMAFEGYDYKDILNFYYPGSKLVDNYGHKP